MRRTVNGRLSWRLMCKYRRGRERAQASRRLANERKAAGSSPATDPQGLVEFACECNKLDCEKSVKVPLYVYRRMVKAPPCKRGTTHSRRTARS